MGVADDIRPGGARRGLKQEAGINDRAVNPGRLKTRLGRRPG
jgi:hypothetical protein